MLLPCYDFCMIERITSETQELHAEIAKFLVIHKMAPSAFGEAVCRDRSLILKLKAGRELRFETRQKIKKFMDDYKPEKK